MWRYLLNRLWENKLARFATLGAILVISFALIFNSRDRLYLSLSRLFSTPNWGDVATYAGKPFAFNEDATKAERLTAKAWEKIARLSEKALGVEETKNAVIQNIRPRPYSQFLNKNAETNIFYFFNLLASNCGHLVTDVSITTKNNDRLDHKDEEEKLKKHLKESLLSLLQIQQEYAEGALQKKPDYIPAIELSGEVFRAACSMREVAPLLSRALDFREYTLQKNIFEKDSGRTYINSPELFDAQSREAYKADLFYRDLTLRYFEATKFRTLYDSAHLKNMRSMYSRIPNTQTLASLIQALLAEAQHGTPGIAQKCHYELFALDYPGISERADYLYALAETAVRAGEDTRAKNIIANALKSTYIKDESMRRDLERLRFLLDLNMHESENISRF
ncbi:MAG: hypothetical protein LDLANPLL_02727 [Turneriella sp.]|nr:hypothetical protein [Turneriella sp.]